MAIIITPASIRDASGVSAPITSSNPQTNSTVETKTAFISGKGTCASLNVWRISCRRVALKSLARPERKNSKPTATRARRMPTHSNACSSLTRIRAHDIIQRVKVNSRAVNEIKRLIVRSKGLPPPVIEGYTGDQRVLLEWAQAWRGKVSDDYVKKQVVSDPHCPPQVRVIGPRSKHRCLVRRL